MAVGEGAGGVGGVFGTVGVSENIIEASWQALVDGDFRFEISGFERAHGQSGDWRSRGDRVSFGG